MAGVDLAVVGYAIQAASIAYSIYSLATAPDGPNIQQSGSRISDLRATISRVGVAIPRVYGSARIGGNVIDMSDIRETAVSTTTSGGGKGPDPGSVTSTSYIYDADVDVMITDGEIIGIRRIWADGRLVYTRSETAGIGASAFAAGFASDVRVYLGTQTQLPDPAFEALRGAGNVPGYRGRSHIVFEGLQLGQFGNRVPSFTFEVLTVSGTLVNLPITTILDGTDANYSGIFCGARNQNAAGVGVWCGAYGIVSFDLNTGGLIAHRNYLGAASLGFAGTAQGMEFSGVGVDGSGAFYTLNRGLLNGSAALMLNKWDGTLNPLWTVVVFVGDPGSTPAQLQCVATVAADSQVVYGYQGKAYRASMNTPNAGDAVTPIELAPWSACMQKFGDAVAWLHDSGSVLTLYRYDANGLTSAVIATGTTNPKHQIAVDRDLFLYVGTIVAGATRIHKINQASLALVATVDLAPNHADVQEFFVLSNGNLLVKHGTEWRRIDFNTGSQLKISATTKGASSTASHSGIQRGDTVFWGFNSGSERDVLAVEGTSRLALPTGSNRVKVGKVVLDLLEQCGVPSGSHDLTAINSIPMDGLVISRVAAARQTIEILRAAYQFDLIESEYKLKAVVRGGSSAVTIPYSDLLLPQGGDPIDPIEVDRAQDLELPRKLTLNFLNLSNDYQDGTESAERPFVNSTTNLVIDMPLVLAPNDAAQICAKLIDSAIIARTKVRFPTSRKHTKFEPGDTITVQTRAGSSLRIRVLERRNLWNRVDLSGEVDDAITYNPNAVGGSSTVSNENVTTAGLTRVEYLDVPLIRDADDGEELYVAMAGTSGQWPGGAVYRSPDNATYFQVGAVTTPAVIGITTTALNDWLGGNVVDTVSRVTVQLTGGGTLSSTDFAGLLAGSNCIVIGNEILFYRTATLVSAGVYTLSDFLRGRRGTEQHVGTHAAGERFVLMNGSGVIRPGMDSSDIGITRFYRAATFGQAQSTAATTGVNNSAAGLKPYSSVYPKGVRNSSNDLTITWIPRARLNANWRVFPLPVGEATESYAVDIMGPGAVVKRTFLTPTPSIVYDASMQTTDFGSPQTTPGSVAVRIYKVSAIVGRGFVLAAGL